MKKITVFFCLLLFYREVMATYSDTTFSETTLILHTANGDIFGTLTTPVNFKHIPVALIIAGSGPTDRNGNNSFMTNNALKQLAYGLSSAKIASLRFDKRGIGESAAAGKKEADLRFEDYVSDAKAWINLLNEDKRFTGVSVIGHSEGSLIGMIAWEKATKFISIAGAGQSAHLILKEQLQKQLSLKDSSLFFLDSLKAGYTVSNKEPLLQQLLRPSVQPYLISWFKFDPQTEIRKVRLPVMVIQGTSDLQVKEEDAYRLLKAKPDAQLVLIKGMNHVLKICGDDETANMKSYNDPAMLVSEQLIKEITAFIYAR